MSNSYDINVKFVVRWCDFSLRQNQRESSKTGGGVVSGGNRTDQLRDSFQSELHTGEYIVHLFACVAAKELRSAEAGTEVGELEKTCKRPASLRRCRWVWKVNVVKVAIHNHERLAQRCPTTVFVICCHFPAPGFQHSLTPWDFS